MRSTECFPRPLTQRSQVRKSHYKERPGVDQVWELKAKIEALLVASDHAVTIESLAQCLEVTEDEADEALREFEADLMAADRGIQLRRRAHGVRIETKPQYTGLIGRLLPERKPK